MNTYQVATLLKPTKNGWMPFIVCTKNEWTELCVIHTLGM